jgi:hypothetical protein
MRTTICLLAAATVLMAWPRPSLADAEKTLDYRYESVWSGAVRLIRADKGYPVKDQDRDNGYILFVYPGEGSVKECTASLQMFRIVDDRGYRRVKVKLVIQHQPSYVEVAFLEKLEQKLREDYGAAPPPEKEPDKPKQPPKDQPPKDQPPEQKP